MVESGRRAGPVRVLGVGNADRGDDAAGRAAARALRSLLGDRVEVLEVDGEATDLLTRFEDASAVFVIDACVSGAAPGTLHRFDVASAPLPQAAFGVSSHGLGLRQAIGLARTLGQLPRSCVVYAIEGAAFDLGAPMTPAVAAAATQAAECVYAELPWPDPVAAISARNAIPAGAPRALVPRPIPGTRSARDRSS